MVIETVGSLYSDAVQKLSKITQSAPFEAAQLMKKHFGFNRADIAVKRDISINLEKAEEFSKDIQRRINGEPLQYILGEWDFYSLSFIVDENVLIPRQDTELLVQKIIESCNGKSRKILELCTGSGCIAISVAKNLENCEVTALELSDGALYIAEKNKEKLCVNNIRFLKQDVLSEIPCEFNGKFDLIAANPPYIKTCELDKLQKEVLFEPKMALDGGGDGLLFYRKIAKDWSCALIKGGKLMVEIGFDQANEVVNIFKENRFEN